MIREYKVGDIVNMIGHKGTVVKVVSVNVYIKWAATGEVTRTPIEVLDHWNKHPYKPQNKG